MIGRATLALAAALAALPLASATAGAPGWAPYGYHRHHAALHRGYGVRHAWHRRVLYRSPYARAGLRRHHGWHAYHRGFVVRAPYVARVGVEYRAYPIGASYVGGPLSGAVYNQPLCRCY